ncbi:penicillin-binding protein 2 [Candidatus Margulisiibacteriota bacterium]
MLRKNHLLIAGAIIIFALLYLRLIQLQIAEHDRFDLLAIENAATTVPDPAPRGVIYDRFGKVMLESRPIFSVRVLPYVLAKKSPAERKRIMDQLGGFLGQDIKFKVTATEPLIVKDNISLSTAIRISEMKRRMDGVVVSSRPVRLSKYGSVASHVLGYVGEIEKDELVRLRRQGYRLGDFVGKDGVEKVYDDLIRGVDGGKKVEVDVYGTPMRVLESLDPVPGPDVKLTIDLDLQLQLEKSLSNQGEEGAAVVMDARTGEILAMASFPNYDPNIFTDPKENWKWKELEQEKHPFMNRALAIYPPGSIFKIVTLSAALEEKVAEPDEVIPCYGSYKVHNRVAKCWLHGGHGPVDVREGLVWSCDVVFYELGKRLGPDKITKYAKAYGLGDRTGIDLPQEKKGFLPTVRWKEKNSKWPWFDGDSINYGIGQGFVMVTPLQMAVAFNGIATGKIVKPYVMKEIRNREGEVLYSGTSEVMGEIPVSAENQELIRGLLRQVVVRATGVAAWVQGIPAAGKTGTAENPGLAHAWFMCYAPYDDPEIVIASFVAHGEHGDRPSAYVAREVLQWYQKNRLAKEYPPDAYRGQYILHRGKIKVPYRGNPEPGQRGSTTEAEG